MATVIARLNAGINFFADLVGYTIRVNYFLGEALFTLLSWAFGHVSTGTRALLALIRVALFDFGQFVEDVGNGLSSVVLGFDVLANLVAQFIHNIFYAFLSALASFVAVVIGVGSSVYVTLSSVLDAGKYLLQVGGKSFILLVQTLPLSLAEAFKRGARSVSNWCSQIADLTVDAVVTLYDGFAQQAQNVRYLVKGLPGEAYLGLGLLLFIVFASHYALRLLYLNRVFLLHKVYQLSLNMLSALRDGSARLSWNALGYGDNRVRDNDADESSGSSFDSPSPYNLRQRKKGPGARVNSRLEQELQKLRQEKESRLCVICADRMRSVLIMPCRHFSFCDPCLTQALEDKPHCPICRQHVRKKITVFQ
ncbi:uncharacterized protein LOC100900628 [Galendromus occidentalis]|uniref:Uncharacterized protein LOC100900628 n=1 Tax=Galendromus occidentalis TaxID=34638 RepID=A0AAJ6VXA0_9ACAR|nr:uncharacterized protein LOC100900628 [Galendromus occidentalis]